MVAEKHPFVGGDEIAAVILALGRSGTRVIEHEKAGSNECRIQAIRNEITTDRGDDEPYGIERFAAVYGDCAECPGANSCNNQPNDDAGETLHFLFAAVAALMNLAMSCLSLASEGGWTYIMCPAS